MRIGLGLWETIRRQSGFDPRTISGCKIWQRSDLGITLGASPLIAAWANQVSGGNGFAQADSALQPTLGTYNAVDAVNFANSDRMVFSGAKSYTNFSHNGLGCTIVLAAKHNSLATYDCYWATGRNVSTTIGQHINVNAAGVVRSYCSNSTGTFTYSINSGATVLGTTQMNIIAIRHSTAYGVQMRINKSTVVAATPYSAAASTADSTYDLTIGDNALTGMLLDAYLPEIIAYDTVISDVDLGLIEAYLSTRYAIP